MDGDGRESFVVGVGRFLIATLSLVCRDSQTSEPALVRILQQDMLQVISPPQNQVVGR